jgi:hypothetical protein
MEAPFSTPGVDAGADAPGEGKACGMERVFVLSGEALADPPACIHPVLIHLSRRVFDMMSTNDGRHSMTPYIGRLCGTTPPDDEAKRRYLAVGLAKAGVDWAQASAGDPERDRLTPDERLLALFSSVLDAYDALTGRTEAQYCRAHEACHE